MRILVSITLFLFAMTTYALTQNECTNVDLRWKLGEVRNQGDVGWCYANASADILSAFLGMGKMGHMSAVQMAMIYNFSHEESLMAQGGVMHQTLKIALRPVMGHESHNELIKFGFCPNSLEARAMEIGPRTSLMTKIKKLNEFKALYDAGKRDPIKSRMFWETYMMHKTAGSILAEIPEAYVINSLEKSTPANFLLWFADIICGQDRRYFTKQSNPNNEVNVINHYKTIKGIYTTAPGQTCSMDWNYDLVPEIHREISTRDNIVGIGFYISLLERDGTNSTTGTGHAATVVGRRWKNNSCQLLVRNSWGKVCDEMDRGEKVSKYSKFVQECDGGNVWIKEADLEKSLTNITYLQRGEDRFIQQLPDRPDPKVCLQSK